MLITAGSVEETERVARELVDKLAGVSRSAACVVCLHGDLGSGKTTFTKGVAKALGVKGPVTSPTFVVEKIYKIPKNDNVRHLVHIDAYRLESGEELKILGWEKIVADPQNIIFIEWPEHVSDILPKERYDVTLRFIDEHTREIEYMNI